ncbi:DHS-like NAD/FAD-binding domain-containing protein [Lipomyces oligophaga]|uniref:DHS-like NAD/FAD-binding domain-containing protein n=1 Tax=Lipomyces oligophaga TaxID=45792 RepID=UPI0034CFF1CA
MDKNDGSNESEGELVDYKKDCQSVELQSTEPIQPIEPIEPIEQAEDQYDQADSWEDIDGDSDNSEDEMSEGEKLLSDEECHNIRTFLREQGRCEFYRKYLMPAESSEHDNSLAQSSREYSVLEILYALGIRISGLLEDSLDESTATAVLDMAISRELARRTPLADISTVADVVRRIKQAENIVFLTGAGISTSLGIPDFRSESGIYAKLEKMGLNEPQEVFDLQVFREDPRIFYTFAKDILPTVSRFSPTHAFIKLVQDHGKLLTNYTQNIDNLESYAGIAEDKLVQCHGSFAKASCRKCGHKVDGKEIFEDITLGRVARCKQLRDNTSLETTRKRKRNDDDDLEDEETDKQLCDGVMKPDIIFFGEALPNTFETRLLNQDIDKCDLLICMGTSLKVAPVSEIIRVMPPHVPQIYVSRTPCTHAVFDVTILGDCDDVVELLADELGNDWNLEHDMVDKSLPELVLEQTSSRMFHLSRSCASPQLQVDGLVREPTTTA